jgi:Holliday junction resolvase-like predicted endonuclease
MPGGKSARRKGRAGESEAKNLLLDRDWTVADLTAGLSTEDLIAVDTDGISWSVEVKNTKAITVQHRQQAMENAKKRKMRWMLMSKLHGTSSWLVQRQGAVPDAWHAKKD